MGSNTANINPVNPAISLSDCHIPVDRGDGVLLQGEMLIEQGSRVLLVGPNGAGKSSLLLLLTGLIEHSKGTLKVLGQRPSLRDESFRRRIGLLLQNVEDQLIAPTVFDDVALSLRAQGIRGSKLDQQVSQVMSKLGIEHLSKRPPHHLSGGEKKLVALGGAMVHEPELLILDEPFAGLDYLAVERVTETLMEFGRCGTRTLIIATHEMDTAATWASQIYGLQRGVITGPIDYQEFLKNDEVRRSLGVRQSLIC